MPRRAAFVFYSGEKFRLKDKGGRIRDKGRERRKCVILFVRGKERDRDSIKDKG
jgi:hypothetical protein